MNIREMTESDVPAVARCHAASWQTAFRGIVSDGLLDGLTVLQFQETWTHILKRANRTNLVAESETEILGFVAFGPPPSDDRPGQDETGEIYGIYVHPDHWRNGTGGQLLTSAFHRMTTAGFARTIVWTMADNSTSRRFYEKEGMKLTGRTRTSVRRSEEFEEVEYVKETGA